MYKAGHFLFMDVILVGTGTGVPSRRRNAPCIFMKFGYKRVIFDSGPGTLKNLLRLGVDCLNLDFIFYTHLHLDHISEFAAILFAAKIPPTLRAKPLAAYGPIGLKDYHRKLTDLYAETISADSYSLSIEEIENKKIDVDGFTVSARTLEHHGGGMGYRITTPEGKIVVYSGDTDYCSEVIELSKGADLAILECSFPDEMKMKGHLTPVTASRIANSAGVKKLALVHMYPICDQYELVSSCKKEFEGEVLVGEDLMQFEIT